jgi:3-(3-hydroxy-phenyl)propionate hydroxylase
VFLAGDAAHVNNPLGAFGLNSGIHDAISLAEKLGSVWRGEADDALLDLYVRQRRMAAVEQVERMSIRNKRQLEERDPNVQRKRLQELMAIAKDPERARHLLTSMISGLAERETDRRRPCRQGVAPGDALRALRREPVHTFPATRFRLASLLL